MNSDFKLSPLITPERVQSSIRARFNPLRGLTPDLLASYLDAFRLGFFRNIALAWDAIERRDDKLAAVAAKRKKSIARNGWEILTVNDSPAALQQKQALEENETGGLSLPFTGIKGVSLRLFKINGARTVTEWHLWQLMSQLGNHTCL